MNRDTRILAAPGEVGLDGQIRKGGAQGVVVLGERHTKEPLVSSVQLAAAGDGGRGHVVADHSVHIPRGLHGGEAVEEPLLRATTNHLCRGA